MKSIQTGIVVFLLVAIGKVFSLGKDISMSSIFGTSWQADAYFVANGAPLLIFSAFYATIPLVFLPLYAKIKLTKGDGLGFIFANNFISIFLFLSLILSVLSIYFAPDIIELISQDLPNNVRFLSIDLARIFSLSFVFTMLVGVFSAMQYVNKFFLGTQLIPIINNLLVIIAIVFLSKYYGMQVIAYFALLAWLIQVPLQFSFIGGGYRFKFKFKDESIKKLFILFIPAFFGVLIDQVNILVDLYLASGLREGSISALSYASRLAMLLGLTIPIIITTVMYPYYSDYAATNMTQRLSLVLEKSIKFVFLLTIPIFIISALYQNEIISILFERGMFDNKSSAYTGEIFFYYTFVIIFIGLREVFNKVFFALQKPKVIFIISLFSVTVNIILSFSLVHYMGVVGIALATSISVLMHVIVQFIVLNTILKSRFYRKLPKLLLHVSIASILMLVAFFLLNQSLLMLISPVSGLIIVIATLVVTYIGGLYFLRQKETVMLVSFIWHGIYKKRSL